jgi:superfamily II DNA or RNA helicase
MPPLSQANSLSELAFLADAAGMDEALHQPAVWLWTSGQIPLRVARALEAACGNDPRLSLGALLRDRQRWAMLKRQTDPGERRQLLRAAREMLESPRPLPEGMRPPQRALPSDFAALIAWASARGIPDALYAPLRVLPGPVPKDLHRLPLLAALTRDVLRDRVVVEALAPHRPAVEAWLEQRAREVATAVEEESGYELEKPVDGRLAGARDQLLTLRQTLRFSWRPLPRALVREAELAPGAQAGSVIIRSDLRPYVQGRSLPGPAEILLELSEDHETPDFHCSCGYLTRGGCAHVLDAVDAVLDALVRGHPVVEPLAQALGAPRWLRTLDELEQVGKARARAGALPEGARLVWRFTPPGEYAEPRLKPVLIKPLKKGGWSAGSPLSLDQLALVSLDRPADRGAAALLREKRQRYPVPLALTLLVGAPNVVLETDGRPVSVHEGPVSLRCAEDGKGGFRIDPAILGHPIDPMAALGDEPAVVAFDAERRRVLLGRIEPHVKTAARILLTRGHAFPADASGPILDRLAGAGLPIDLPASLLGAEHTESPAWLLVLERPSPLQLTVEVHVRPLPGGLSFPAGQGPEQVRGERRGQRVFARRDLEGEATEAAGLLESLGLPAQVQALLEGEEALRVLSSIEQRAKEGLEVRWPAVRPRVSRVQNAGRLSVRVEEGRDWFGLKGQLALDDGEVGLSHLLEAARRKARYVQVGEDQFVELAESLRAQLEPLAALAFEGKHGTEVPLSAAGALEALAPSLERFETAPSFRSLVERMRQADGMTPALPAGLTAQLRPYQREGFAWMARTAAWSEGACLADDMGLGKTLQALTLLLSRAPLGPQLVVAPTSVCFNWEAEAQRFAPSLRLHLYRTADREALLERLGPSDVVVVSYGLLTRDVGRFEKVAFSTLVLDEAQAIKNAAAQRAQAVRRLDARFRLALTGTPLENHLGELWSLFRILVPGLLGSEALFRERFLSPIEKDRDAGRRRALADLIRPFLLRRTKGEVATDLPPKTEIAIPVALSPQERALYDQARLAAVAELNSASNERPEQQRFRVLAAITRLRLLACHPGLHDPTWTGPASKLEAFLGLVDALREEGHRALVFSQFIQHLDKVRGALAERKIAYRYLDGSTPEAQRRAEVEAFQRGEGELFLLSLKAGGTGLNLTGADNVIHLDPWWNPAVEDQATDRAHRIGQTLPVTVYRLVTQGTLEEQILALHAQKRELVAGILEGTGDAARLDTDALAALLERGRRALSEDELDAPDAPEVPDERDGPAELEAERGNASRAQPGDYLSRVLEEDARTGGLARAFQAWLSAQHAAGRIGKGPTVQYPRAVDRFLSFASERPARLSGAEPETLLQSYLAALASGEAVAPRSEPILAKAALRKLALFLEASRAQDPR